MVHLSAAVWSLARLCCWSTTYDPICWAGNGPGIDDRPSGRSLPRAGEINAACGAPGHLYDISMTYTKTQSLTRRLNNLASGSSTPSA
jgi:hypothetical protein